MNIFISKLLKSFLFFAAISLTFLFFTCKHVEAQSAIKVASDFLEAGTNGDFKKLSGLCCKDNGPYTTFEDVRSLDLGELGSIEKIVREENSEFDPSNLKLVVIRSKELGQFKFVCLYAFNTPPGWKIYLNNREYLWDYPPSNLSISFYALQFYITNKIKLDSAQTIALQVLNKNPNNLDYIFKLGQVYSLQGKIKDSISQYKTLIKKDRAYADKKLPQRDLLSACEDLLVNEADNLKNSDKELLYFIAEKLFEMKNDQRAVPILLEKWSENLYRGEDYQRENAAKMLMRIGNKKAVQYLAKALEQKICIVTICGLLRDLGDESAIPSLKKALYFEYKGGNAALPLAVLAEKINQKNMALSIIKDAFSNHILHYSSYTGHDIEGYLNSLAFLTGDANWKKFGWEPTYTLSFYRILGEMYSAIAGSVFTSRTDIDILNRRLDSTAPNYQRTQKWILERWKEVASKGLKYTLEKIEFINPSNINLIFNVELIPQTTDKDKVEQYLNDGYKIIDKEELRIGNEKYETRWTMRKQLAVCKLAINKTSDQWMITDINEIDTTPIAEAPILEKPKNEIDKVNNPYIAPNRPSEPVKTYTEADLIRALKNADYIITGGKNYTIRWITVPNVTDRRKILEKINNAKETLNSAAEIAKNLSNEEALSVISQCEGALDRDLNDFNRGGGGKRGLRDAQRIIRD